MGLSWALLGLSWGSLGALLGDDVTANDAVQGCWDFPLNKDCDITVFSGRVCVFFGGVLFHPGPSAILGVVLETRSGGRALLAPLWPVGA